MLQQTGRI